MERDSKTTKSYKAERTTNSERTCTGPGEYTLSDFLTHFRLPSLVTVMTGYHSENNEEDFSLASGQQLTIHAVHKNGTIVAKTFNKEPQNVYIPMDCCQLAELRPNGIKDFLDDSPITFQEVLHHFQFPLFISTCWFFITILINIVKICTKIKNQFSLRLLYVSLCLSLNLCIFLCIV